MTTKFYFRPSFEVRSVLLLAALTVGGVLVAHSQGVTPGAAQAAGQSPTARAAPSQDEIGAAFARADANQDGKLSRQEAVRFPAVEQRFDQIDSNQDKFVSREEFVKALKP